MLPNVWQKRNKPKCRICRQKDKDLLRMRQIGVNNCIRTHEESEPDMMFDFLICPVCGDIKIDTKTIRIQYMPGLFTGMEREKK